MYQLFMLTYPSAQMCWEGSPGVSVRAVLQMKVLSGLLTVVSVVVLGSRLNWQILPTAQ